MVRMSSLWTGKEFCPGNRLLKLRGRGSFGSVWEAETTAGEIAALKFLPCADHRAVAMEIRAIQAIRALRHPNLTRIHEVWCHGGYIVVVMELADGSLHDLLEAYQSEFGTPVPPEELCRYLTQAADALDFLNARQHDLDGRCVGFQHCDIKPSNILLFEERVKLCDFGLASPISTQVSFHRLAGTLDYTAPEVFQGRLTQWTDQFSLAVTYCELRSGQRPFPEPPATFQPGYVRPAADLSMLEAAERAIVARALAPTPQERWPSCRDLVYQLADAVKPARRR